MTGPDDNERDNFPGLHGPSQSDMDRFNREEDEYLDERKQEAKSAVWKLVAGAVFILVAGSMVLNVLLPALSRNQPVSTGPERTPATVLRVFDGRTIGVEVDGAERTVRYIGIDIPEFGDPLYEVAVEANRQWLIGSDVLLEADELEVDEQGRLLRYVWLDGAMVNEIMLAAGLASVDGPSPNSRYRDALEATEDSARSRGLGIWNDVESDRTAVVPDSSSLAADGHA